jgi:hypothetical protein
MSALIDSDEDFINMMRTAFGVDPNVRPAPPDYAIGKGALAKDLTPMGKKTHGDYISWNQEPSSLEVDAIRTIAHKKTVNRAESGDSKGNIILWEGDNSGNCCYISNFSLGKLGDVTIVLHVITRSRYTAS